MATSEHIEAMAGAMSPRPLDSYRHLGSDEPPTVVAMKKRAERLIAAIRTDPVVLDAVLTALVDSGRLMEESLSGVQGMTDTRCPACGIPVTGWRREGSDKVSIDPCGCWVTCAQALPVMRARGDA